MKLAFYIVLFLILQSACGQFSKNNDSIPSKEVNNSRYKKSDSSFINSAGTTISTRFRVPDGFIRTDKKEFSFAKHLQELPLKPHGSLVNYYDGRIKKNNAVYAAVIDLKIGTKDLHQCADAIIRLRAEYLWENKKYADIHFNFTNGFRVDYTPWMNGKRIKVQGNNVSWIQRTNASNTYIDLWSYLELIFNYAGTLSLAKELMPIDVSKLDIGDVFIVGGSPGHAIIVVDMAFNPTTKEKVFLLAQSYMPAQEIQILVNRQNKDLSPWYKSDFGDNLNTPEWNFSKTQLKRFSN